MTTRRDFTAGAGAFGLGAGLAALGRLAGPAAPTPPPHSGLAWVNVRNEGVRGDGETDDTEALQKVFTERSGGVIYFPGGVYRISRTIRVPHAVSIVGDGGRATYLHSRITDGSPVLEIGHADFSERLRSVRIADLTVRGVEEGRLRSGGIRLHAFYDSLVSGVRIETMGWGLECHRAISVQFDNLVVTGMRDGGGLPGDGVYLYGQSNGCLFNNLRSADHSAAAIRLGDGQNLTLVAPVIESVRSPAVVIGRERDGRYVKCRGVTLLNPYFEKNRPHDLLFLRGTPPTIIGGYWGPLHRNYVSPIASQLPVTAIGCDFPAAPGGALRVTRPNAAGLFLGCTFSGEVATFAEPALRRSARLRILGAEGERMVGGNGPEE